MSENWKKKYKEAIETIDFLERLVEDKNKNIKELKNELDEYRHIEANKMLYANFKQGEQYKIQAEHYKALYEHEKALYEDLKSNYVSNTESMEKARKVKKQKQYERIKEYQEKIIEIVKENKKIKVSELIELLEINNKTFYNYKLNKFFKEIQEKGGA